MTDTDALLPGEILCRFPNHSPETRAYGRIILKMAQPRLEIFQPKHKRWDFTNIVISNMVKKGIFSMPVDLYIPVSAPEVIDIKFVADNFQAESISACPFPLKALFSEE